MVVNRYWYELHCVSPSWQYALCPSQCSGVGSGAQVYSSSGDISVQCGSISWSGTLNKVVGNLLDPVTGTVSVSE